MTLTPRHMGGAITDIYRIYRTNMYCLSIRLRAERSEADKGEALGGSAAATNGWT